MLSPKKAEEIIATFEKYSNSSYNEKVEFTSDIDQDIYSFHQED